jgi:hypothetical protein
MLGSTITLSVNSVNKVLTRVNDSEPYTSNYFLEDGLDEYELKITHTVPKTRGASKESHLVRLDVTTYDSDGVIVRKQSSWTVMETSTGRQDSTTAGYYSQALLTWVGTNKALILARDS